MAAAHRRAATRWCSPPSAAARARVRSAAADRRDLRPARAPSPSRSRSTRSCARRRVPRADRLGARSTPATSTALLLPGGHAPGMRQYLGSDGAAARRSPRSGRSSGRSARSATACSCWRGRATPPPAGASSPTGAPPACPSTWSARVLRDGLAARPLLPHLPAYVEDEVRAALADPSAVRARAARLDQARAPRRRPARVRRRGRQLRLGPLAGRRLPLRRASGRAAARARARRRRPGVQRA